MLGKRLSKGDTIGIVAPASFGDREKLEIAKENLEKLGYKVKLGKCTQNSYFSYSDTDYNRAMEINDLFKDREVAKYFKLEWWISYRCYRKIILVAVYREDELKTS